MILLFILLAITSSVLSDKYAQIDNYINEIDENGNGFYNFKFETSNGISAQAAGVGGIVSQGAAQWYAPDGTGVQFSYTADVNGYNAVGTHIPKPPPVPDYILRAQEYMKTHPWVEPEFYRKKTNIFKRFERDSSSDYSQTARQRFVENVCLNNFL